MFFFQNNPSFLKVKRYFIFLIGINFGGFLSNEIRTNNNALEMGKLPIEFFSPETMQASHQNWDIKSKRKLNHTFN